MHQDAMATGDDWMMMDDDWRNLADSEEPK